jgi:hypothetical protein
MQDTLSGRIRVARYVPGQRLCVPHCLFEQRRVLPHHQSQYRLADRTLERTDVMPFDDWFNRRKLSLDIADGAFG